MKHKGLADKRQALKHGRGVIRIGCFAQDLVRCIQRGLNIHIGSRSISPPRIAGIAVMIKKTREIIMRPCSKGISIEKNIRKR